jgi:hypothetical protein
MPLGRRTVDKEWGTRKLLAASADGGSIEPWRTVPVRGTCSPGGTLFNHNTYAIIPYMIAVIVSGVMYNDTNSAAQYNRLYSSASELEHDDPHCTIRSIWYLTYFLKTDKKALF